MALWEFNAQHEVGLIPPGGSVQYSWPKCQIYSVVVQADTTGNGQTLLIYGQGFLKGARVQIIEAATNSVIQEWQQVDPDSASTFRYARITRSAALASGTYHVTVINVLDASGAVYQIDTPTVTFQIA